jgi:hypothetical protein
MNGHDLVAHLYATSLELMRRHGQAFLPLDAVEAKLGWPTETMHAVVDHCVRTDPVVGGRLRAEWMDDGERRAFGQTRMRFIGIRPVEARGETGGAEPRRRAGEGETGGAERRRRAGEGETGGAERRRRAGPSTDAL